MFDLGQELAVCHAVASQLVRHDHARHVLKAFEQPSEESFRGSGVSPWLNEDVEHDAVLVDGPPEVVKLTTDPDE